MMSFEDAKTSLCKKDLDAIDNCIEKIREHYKSWFSGMLIENEILQHFEQVEKMFAHYIEDSFDSDLRDARLAYFKNMFDLLIAKINEKYIARRNRALNSNCLFTSIEISLRDDTPKEYAEQGYNILSKNFMK